MSENLNFEILIEVDRKPFVLKVERVHKDDTFERYRVSSRVSSAILQCNWPVLRRRHLKHKMPNWSTYEGSFNNRAVYEKVVVAIERYLKVYFAENPDF